MEYYQLNKMFLNKLKYKFLLNSELFGLPKFQIPSYFELINKNKKIIEELKNTHNKYIAEISSPDMAISFELAQYLFIHCIHFKPNKIIDLGSGFSSFIFLSYKSLMNPDCNIISIDDDTNWLNKTKVFLMENKLPVDNLFSLNEVKEELIQDADLIFYDLNFVQKRMILFDYFFKNLSKNGILICDDAHKIEYLRFLKIKSQEYKSGLFHLKHYTLDTFERFSIFIIK
jgi:hypothetical protein